MEHGTLVTALIVLSARVSRVLSCRPVRLVSAASVKNRAMMEMCNKFCFDFLQSPSSIHKSATPGVLVSYLKHA